MTYPQMGPPAQPAKKDNPAANIAIFIALLLVLAGVLLYFNIVSCGFYSPLGCEIYYGLTAGGKPKVLIVSGNEGMGNPEFLYETFKSPRLQARASTKELELVTLPLLQQHQLVIVERAKTMKISELKMFEEYVSRGGRLVWVGDAGTRAPESESDQNYFLKFSERKKTGSQAFIGPWARKSGNNQVSFDYLLGVDYIGNYCEMEKCSDGYIGFINFPNQDEKLTLGLSQNLKFYGDFSIVKTNSDAYQKNLALLDYGSNLITTPSPEYFWIEQKRQEFGQSFPVIVASGVGGRVAYYSFPPEYFVSENMPIDPATGKRAEYWGIIENMYYGMLYK